MSRGEPAVVIMARAPVPGAVKTRLEPLLGPVGCARLQAAARFVPELFTIDPALWGGPEVLAASAEQTERTGLRMGLLPPLRDLDTPEDAPALLDGGALPSDIAALLGVAPEPA